MYKFPIRVSSNVTLQVAQQFHVSAPVDISNALRVQTVDHLGVDIVCAQNGVSDPKLTWGQDCVWPFPWPGIVYESLVDSQFGATQHAHAQIDTTDPDTGIKYSLIYLHNSSVTKSKSALDSTVVTYNYGDVIGKIGNNGAVSPMPTPERPYDGSHLHLGLGVCHPGEQNFTMVDPLTIFDPNNPFTSAYKFTRELGLGASGADVKALQQRLGMSASNQTGYFGYVTKGYVFLYQIKNGITPFTGYVGPKTLAFLNA